MSLTFFSRLLALVACTFAALSVPSASAATITVTNTSGSGGGSLSQAINSDAADGDTIVFSNSLSGATITLTRELAISRSLTIDGSTLATPVRISGNNVCRIFSIDSGVTTTLSHLGIVNGRVNCGAGEGIYNGAGGGVFNAGTLTIRSCTISGNTAGNSGGGIYSTGTLTAMNSTINGNSASGAGGIYNTGTMTILASTISSNTSVSYVGGIYNSGVMSVRNSTITGNVVTSGNVGAIGNYQGGMLTILSSTICGNSAYNGSCLANHSDGTVTMGNNIFASNGDSFSFMRDTRATFISLGHNASDNWRGMQVSATDLSVLPSELKLGTLADNGGPTMTCALLLGSVAIDAGLADSSIVTDQRGIPRPQGTSSDIGAYELITPVVTSISRLQPGPLTTSSTVTWRVTFSENVTGVDATDFTLTPITGAAAGTISSVGGSGTVYTVTTSLTDMVGTLRLDVKASGTGIIDSNGTPLTSGYTCGQTYTHVRNTAPVAWGANYSGQLGNNSTPASAVPTTVFTTGALKDRAVVALAGGQSHSLALTSDGQVFAWGWNDNGTLGNNSAAASSVPVAVATTGVLSGKLIVAIAGGQGHSLALGRDGHVYAWGENGHGQLGNNSMIGSLVPVEVTATGVLTGKTVIAVSAGRQHNLALTSDGQIYAWGSNSHGELGNNSRIDSSMPVAVATTGTPLAGKAVIAISAGEQHSLALTSDGQVYAWGNNVDGRLGDGSRVDRLVPVAVTTAGVLSGKAVVAIAASSDYSLVMTSDGQVFAWGWNTFGNLGNNSIVASSEPVAVTMSGVLSGKTVVAIAAAGRNGQVLTSEGRVYAWGDNSYGELGNNSSTYSWVPVEVGTDAANGSALAGRSVYTLGTYSCSYHNLALASPMAASSVEGPASGRYWTGSPLAFVVNLPQPVTVNTTGGTPRLAITVGSTTRYATYTSGTGTTALTFTYTVQAGDAATTAIAVASTAIDLNGGSLTDAAGGGVDLTLPSPGLNGAFIAPPMAYAIWAAANFTADEQGNPTLSGPCADPDGAGIPNLLRYALGLPARGPITAATAVALDPASNPSTLTLTFPVRAVGDGLIYEVQSSQDLVNWTTEETYEVSGSIRSQPCSIEVPVGAKRLFLRLHIVQN